MSFPIETRQKAYETIGSFFTNPEYHYHWSVLEDLVVMEGRCDDCLPRTDEAIRSRARTLRRHNLGDKEFAYIERMIDRDYHLGRCRVNYRLMATYDIRVDGFDPRFIQRLN